MGGAYYSADTRAVRAVALNYTTASHTDAHVFKQNALRRVNEGMAPDQIRLREARDSDIHPQAVPIVLGLDVTGSMGQIPAALIRGDLPHLMSKLIDGCCPHAALCFMAVGDLYSDHGPLQVGQFESGDAELDHWLTTCWLEGNGGGNGGESYSLPWLFASNMIKTDAWDKRQQKGLIITIGDEPLHDEMPMAELKRVFGAQLNYALEGYEGKTTVSTEQAYRRASEQWNIHHISVGGSAHAAFKASWALLGENLHVIDRDGSVVEAINRIVERHMASINRSTKIGANPPPPEALQGGPHGDENEAADVKPSSTIPDPI